MVHSPTDENRADRLALVACKWPDRESGDQAISRRPALGAFAAISDLFFASLIHFSCVRRQLFATEMASLAVTFVLILTAVGMTSGLEQPNGHSDPTTDEKMATNPAKAENVKTTELKMSKIPIEISTEKFANSEVESEESDEGEMEAEVVKVVPLKAPKVSKHAKDKPRSRKKKSGE